MSRPLRIEYDGAWYHIYNRGAGRRKVFLIDEDYSLFYDLLNEIYQNWNVQTHAFSLMSNHYHLLIHTPNSNLSRAIRHLSGVYTQRFNCRHKTDGPLFKGRFKSIIVEKDSYLLQLVRYIHLNPVKAGIVATPAQHRWTSHRSYLNTHNKPEWLFTDEVLSQFDKQRKAAIRKLDLFVKEGVDDNTANIFASNRWPSAIGSRSFKDWLKYNFIDGEPCSDEIPEMRKLARVKPSIDDILLCVSTSYNVHENQLFENLQGMRNEARHVAIYLIRKLTNSTHVEISKIMGNSNASTIAKNIQRFQQKLRDDSVLRGRCDILEENIMSNVKT